MDFVDDIDLFPPDAGSKIDLVPQLADVIHGGVGCGIDLDQVQKLPIVHSNAICAAAKISIRKGKKKF